LSQSIDCDPNIPNFQDEVKLGCAPRYVTDDDATTCPTPSNLWKSPQPWFCAATQGGASPGQVDHGLNDRIQLGRTTCADDNAWPTYPLDDRRIVSLFLTPFGSFSGSGNTTVPVTGFATFYITGYGGDPCPHATPTDSGDIVGHFINSVVSDPGATPSPKFCDINSLVPCIPVLVK
jgi:hypothetical protein